MISTIAETLDQKQEETKAAVKELKEKEIQIKPKQKRVRKKQQSLLSQQQQQVKFNPLLRISKLPLKYPQRLFNNQSIPVEVKTNYSYQNQHLLYSKKEVKKLKEVLIPIKLKFEVLNSNNSVPFLIEDNFLWNSADELVSVKMFAEVYCLDLQLPPSYAHLIQQEIQQQISHFYANASVSTVSSSELVEVNLVLEIKNSSSGNYFIKDNFIFNSNDSKITPETFAKVYCAELGLSGEYCNTVSCCIREAILNSNNENELINLNYGIDATGSNGPVLSCSDGVDERKMRRLRRESIRKNYLGRRFSTSFY